MSDSKKRLDNLSPLKRALVALEEMKGKLKTLQKEKNEPIAVIGLGCRLPGARNPEEFWQLLKNGVDGISEVPPERWDADQLYDPEPGKPGKIITKWGGFIEEVDKFDPQFFGISPREAYKMDPQQRLLLEVTWQALENAGIVLPQLSKTRTGVFIGISNNDYSHIQGNDLRKIDAYTGIGNAFSIAANRISYTFDLEGPSLSIDTACSSSLVATHYACQSLRTHESDLALAGGAGLILSPELTVTFSQAQMMSPSGRCRTFDASADGYVRGEGVGIIVLKRLSDAIRDKNHILSVIRGSAVNQDGKSNGLTAPNSLAQQKVIRTALKNAGVKAEDIDYIEAHGTGTILGDPIEVQALGMVMKDRSKESPCYLGSVKTNIGHLEAAAGVAGIIKTILSLKNGQIPPHLHFQKINPHISLDELPIVIPTQLTDFPANKKKHLAGVSAFGFGGTNAHIILEQAPEQPWFEAKAEDAYDEQAQLVVLSAQSENSLNELAEAYGHFAEKQLADGAFSFYSLAADSALKRNHLDYRLAVVAENKKDFSEKITTTLKNEDDPLIHRGLRDAGFQAKAAFVFSGQGPQWWAMGRELMQEEPAFRSAVEHISALLKEYTGWSLIDELSASEQETRLDQTEVAQPALFAIQVALAELWRSWGVIPDAVTGHSVGEVAASYVSGRLTLKDAVKVIYHRSRLMQKATGLGKMAAIDLPFDELKELIAGYEDKLSIGAHNSHTSYVLSGDEQALDAVFAKLEGRDAFHKKLPVNYAFHSPTMEPFKNELKEALQGLELQPMHIPLYSTVTGKVAEKDDYGPQYWANNIRERVRFSETIDSLISTGFNVFIEIGPHPVLKNYIRQNLQDSGKSAHILPSLRRKEAERKGMLSTLAKLYIAGYPINWNKLFPKNAAFLNLPLYPFQRERFWIDTKETSSATETGPSLHPLLGKEQSAAMLPNNSSWTVQLKSDYVAYLNTGQGERHTILPESAYLEMALAASVQAFPDTSAVLQDIIFKNTLNLRGDNFRELHFTLTPVSTSKSYFQAHSKKRLSSGKSRWITHSLGSIISAERPAEQSLPAVSIDELKQRMQKLESPEQLKGHHVPNGNFYSNFFISGGDFWHNQDELLVKFSFTGNHIQDWDSYHIHPIVLNNIVRLMTLIAQSGSPRPLIYKPRSLEKFEFIKSLNKEFWAHIKIERDSGSSVIFKSNIHLFDTEGQPILRANNFRLQEVPFSEAIADLLYEIDWEKLEAPASTIIDLPTQWVVIGEADHLVSRLRQKRRTVISLIPGEENLLTAEDAGEISFRDKESLTDLFAKIISAESAVVLFALWDEEQALTNFAALEHALGQSSVLPEQLWIVTQNALSFPQLHSDPNGEAALCWDMALRLQSLFSELDIRLLDTDRPHKGLFNYLLLPTHEKHLAIRHKAVFVPRMKHASLMQQSPVISEIFPLLSSKHALPAENEIEIEVKATGLNLLDVRQSSQNVPDKLGFECAGVVVRAGKKVTAFKEGDEVLAVARGCFNKYVATSANLAVPKPEKLTFEEAAAIPLNYIAAHYALTYLAHLNAGESVLILDADTPEGLANLMVAQSLKARIYATVLNAEHRDLVRDLGVKHVFDDRNLDFIDRINSLTSNEGVDVIVNTVRNDHVSNSFSILKEFGRFVELNTQDTFDQPIVYHNLRRNIAFFAVDILHMSQDQQKLFQRLFGEIVTRLSDGTYRLTPAHSSGIAHLPVLFRQVEHNLKFGKIVVTPDDTQISEKNHARIFDVSSKYLIAGTSSVNDLALALWMARRGAQNIALLTLDETPAVTQKAVERFLKHTGNKIKIRIIEGKNAEDFKDVKGAFISLSSLSGVRHPQKVIAQIKNVYDALAENELEYFTTISHFNLLKTEKYGHKLLNLAHFIRALNRRREQDVLPAMHLQLGGNVPDDMKKALIRWNILSELVFRRQGDFIITEADWQSMASKLPQEKIPGLYRGLVNTYSQKDAAEEESPAEEISRAELIALAPAERKKLLESYLSAEIARVVKVPAAKIRRDQALTTLGIDSLMAIELKNMVESKLGLQLPIAALLKGPSVNDLSHEFMEQLEEASLATAKEEQPLQPIHDTEIREFKLSYGQKAMFFQHMMNPDSIFNLAYAVRIRSDFDKETLRASFQELIDRHPSLRTTFHIKNSEPIQRIHPQMPAFFIEEDSRSWSEEQLHSRLDEEVLNHFDLENGPLLRVFLFQKGAHDHVLLFVMHHIITDIWSQAVLLDELSQIFANGGVTTTLSPVVHDYTDFIRWQDRLLSGESEQKLFSYWKKKLHGDLPLLNIPTDRPRPAVQTFKGSTETIWFPAELSQQIHRFSEQQGITVFTVLLTAYYILLNRYTGQNDIVVGSPTAGRSKREFERTIGYFVNPVPFRTQLNAGQTFNDFLNQVQQTVLEAFDHMDYPLALMVEKLQPERDTSRTPLFQTMFILERAHLMHDQGLSKFALSREGATMDLGGLTIESMTLEQGVAPFDLTMMAVESGSGLAASLGYNIDLFDASTVQRMLTHYITLLESILKNPQKPLGLLEFLPDEERRLVLHEWNQHPEAFAEIKCIHRIIEEHAAQQPQKTALIFEEQQLSYDQLNRRANQLARHLIKLGVKVETIVGISVDRSIEMVVAMLAVLKAGGAYLPIDPTYPPERIRYMIHDAELKFIITTGDLVNKVHDEGRQLILLDDAGDIFQSDDGNPQTAVSADNLAYLIYTSGSTGKPKGAMLRHRGLVNALYSTRENYYMQADSRTLQFASFSFDASVEEIFSTLSAGATLVLVKKETLLSLPDLKTLLKQRQITNITLPPSVLSVLQPEDFSSLQSVVSAGEKCTPEIARRWSKGRYFINGYGPTEATICTTSFEAPDDFDLHIVPIGKPVKNARIYVLDGQLNPVPVGVPGEMYICGEGLARGYYNRPELTAERFLPDPYGDEQGARMYRTGDLVRFLPDGNLEFLDRVDQQVKIRGFRIELGEIEAALHTCPGIREAAVDARHIAGEIRLIAYLVNENDTSLNIGELKNCLLQHLPDYMIPTAFVKMAALPLTQNGKLDRKKLPDPDAQQTARKLVKPGSEIEQKIAEIWKGILGTDQFGVNDSFFELGGHSLGIVQVQGKIKEVFDKDLNVVDMFKYPTIRSLAKFLGDESSTKETIQKSQTRATRQREATKIQQQRMQRRRKR